METQTNFKEELFKALADLGCRVQDDPIIEPHPDLKQVAPDEMDAPKVAAELVDFLAENFNYNLSKDTIMIYKVDTFKSPCNCYRIIRQRIVKG